MPLYDFVCENCGATKEEGLPVAYRDVTVECPNCNTRMRRKINNPLIKVKLEPERVADAVIVDRDQL